MNAEVIFCDCLNCGKNIPVGIKHDWAGRPSYYCCSRCGSGQISNIRSEIRMPGVSANDAKKIVDVLKHKKDEE